MMCRLLMPVVSALAVTIFLGNCATEPVVEEDGETSVVEKREKRGEYPDPRLTVLLPELRKRCEAREPSLRHLGWSIFELEEFVYGRGVDQHVQEFAAVGFELLPDGISLNGAAVVLFSEGKTVESTVTGGITLREDGSFSVEGPGLMLGPVNRQPQEEAGTN